MDGDDPDAPLTVFEKRLGFPEFGEGFSQIREAWCSTEPKHWKLQCFSGIDQTSSGIGEGSPIALRRHSEGETPVSSRNARLNGPSEAKPIS
jgi:hypothetical protein